VNIYPNPTSGSFQMEFFLNRTSDIKISLLNLSGQVIQILDKRRQLAGHHTTFFDAKDLTPGVYFCKLETGQSAFVKKIIILN